MKPESQKKPPVRQMKDGELKALLGDGVLMLTAARPRASSPNTSEQESLSRRPPAQPAAGSTRDV
jgi:hypothetical protein